MAEAVGSPDKGAVSTPASTATTPTATPSPAPSSAPAAAAPVSARPSAAASLAKVAAVAQVASSATTPVEPAPGALPDSAKGAEAKVQPGEAGTVPDKGASDLWTDIPEGRREAITRNIRETAAREATEAVMKEFGWAKEIGQERAMASVGIAVRMAQDPVSFYRQLGQELQQAGMLEAEGGDPDPATSDPEPQPDLQSEDGKKVYSDAQLRKLREWDHRQLEKRFLGHVQPLREDLESRQQRDHVASIITSSREEANQVMTEMRAKPHFKEHEAEIGQALQAIPADVRAKIGAVRALHMAYETVLETKVFPTIEANVEKRVRDGLREKAAVGIGTVTPGGQPAAAVPQVRNVDQLAARMRQMAGTA